MMQIEDTLSKFYTSRMQYERAKHGNQKNQKPVLVLRTENGVKQLKVEYTSTLSIWETILAFFGLGNASLNHISQFLRENKGNIGSRSITSLNLLDEKIVKRNQHFSLGKIQALCPIKLLHAPHKVFTSTTYHPHGSMTTTEEDRKGILDFAGTIYQGMQYVADTTGHADPKKREVVKKIWDDFEDNLNTNFCNKVVWCQDEQEVKEVLKEMVMNLNEKFIMTSSTFTFTSVIEMYGKKYAASVQVGDNTLIHVHQNKMEVIVTKNSSTEASKIELSSLNRNSPIFLEMREVQSGDKIFGLTDGITDYLPTEKLEPILLNEELFYNIKKDLLDVVEEQIRAAKYNGFDPLDKHKSDDIAAFAVKIE